MYKTLSVALNDLRLIFADGSIWINLVVVPLVLAAAIGFALGAMLEGTSAAVVLPLDVLDEDRSEISRNLIAEMERANMNLLICEVGASEALDAACNSDGAPIAADQLQSHLEGEASVAYVLIPKGFGESVQQGEPLTVVYRSREDLLNPSVRYTALQSAAMSAGGGTLAVRMVQSIGSDLPAYTALPDAEKEALLASARDDAQEKVAETPFEVETVVPMQEGQTVSPNAGLAQSIPGMGSMYAVIATLAMASAYVRDRRQGVVQRAMTMAVQPAQLMGGKVLAYFTIGVIQLSLLFIFGALLGLRYGSNLLALVAVMAAFSFAVTGLALFITSLVTTDAQAQSIGLLVGLVMGPLGGAWWSLQIVPRWMQIVGHLTPIAWAMDAYEALIFRDAGWVGVALPVVVLLGMALLYFALALLRIRVRT